MDIRKQGLQGLLKYFLLPITILSVAVLLSRCGQTPTSVQPYKGASLVGEAIVSYDRATNTLAVQNFSAPDITPPTAGAGPTVSIYSVAAPTFSGSQVSGQVYIKNNSGTNLTGVMVVVDSAMSGSVTVANANYGGGFRANAPSAGPWSWWFYAGTSPNFNITNGGQSNNVTWTFDATANFAVKVFIYAFCPSGVVMNRTNLANTPVANAFVMLGNYAGDTNYWTQNVQGAGYTGNYLTATDSNGYFALPVTCVTGSGVTTTTCVPDANAYITYTTGALGNGTSALNAQYDNMTVWGTTFSYVVLPIKQRSPVSGFVSVGSVGGGGDVSNMATQASCGDTYIPAGLTLPMMGFEDLINLSLSTLIGNNLAKGVSAGTGCNANDSSTTMSLPSNMLLPMMNDNVNVYTSASGSTGVNINVTNSQSANGKNYYVPAPRNVTFSFAGLGGHLNNSVLTSLTYSLQNGAPINITGLLTAISWVAFGVKTGVAVGTSNITSGVSTITYPGDTGYSLGFSNGNTILGQYDPSQSYNALGLMGMMVPSNPLAFQLTTQSLGIGTNASASVATPYVAANNGAFPSGSQLLPAVLITDLGKVNANFSASTVIADRTGYTSPPATMVNSSKFLKFIDFNWATTNPNDMQVGWTSAANATSGATPSLTLVQINYNTNFNYTDINGAATSTGVLTSSWEMLMNPAVLNVQIPTLPVYSPGLLLTEATTGRFYDFKVVQGIAHTSINGPAYVWDSQPNFLTVAENYLIGTMDVFSMTEFPIGGAWIYTPANGSNGIGTAPAGKAYINAYNWNIVSQGTPTNLRGCFYVTNASSKASIWSNCTTGTTNCSGLPAVTIASPYAYQQTTLTIGSGVYSSITFTPYNTTAGTSSGGSPACQQVGSSAPSITVHN